MIKYYKKTQNLQYNLKNIKYKKKLRKNNNFFLI